MYYRILIGAPRAQSHLKSQRDINETGAVYECPLENHNNTTLECVPLVIDDTGNIPLNREYEPMKDGKLRKVKNMILNKVNQMLGAAMDGDSSDDGTFVVCAPNIKTFNETNDFNHGMCYTIWINDNGHRIVSENKMRSYCKI